MDIRLKKLTLKNFQGIKSFELNLDGVNASIYGENGVGKTTLYNAFLWVLFDKDSSNRKDFSIKTYDSNNNVIHGLEHEVEAMILFDGKEVKLRKMLTEKWSKKRGESEKEFTGHETAHWVDDVPCKKNEYQSTINEIINENLFKLITNPLYFNMQLSWQDRRKILLEVSGDISDQEVIESNTKLSKISEILNGKSIDDYKKILSEKSRQLNSEIENIPVRIDELVKSLPELPTDYSTIETKLELSKSQLNNIEQKLTNISEEASQYRTQQQELYSLREQLNKRKQIIDDESNCDNKALIDEKSKLSNERYSLENEIPISKNRLIQAREDMRNNSVRIEQLRTEWSKENIKKFEEPSESDFNCPVCGQALPESNIQEQLANMRIQFDNNKKAALEKINVEGKALTNRNIELQVTIDNLAKEVLNNENRLSQINARIAEIDEKLNQETQVPNYEADSEYAILKLKIESLENELRKPIVDKSSELLQQKQAISTEIEGYNKMLNSKNIIEKTNARIEELKQDERKLANQINELEGQKYLIEQFIKTKVDMLEGNINSKFRNVRFKLFETQINGGIAECCDTLVNGVPWSDANHAAQVNSGIDIINTLSEHYKVSAPVWIDNREAINELLPTDSQVINLIVSKDKNLKVEVE